MYETYYDKLEPFFGQEHLQLHYVDTDGMILYMKTENIIKDLKILDIFLISVIWMKIMNYLVTETKK